MQIKLYSLPVNTMHNSLFSDFLVCQIYIYTLLKIKTCPFNMNSVNVQHTKISTRKLYMKVLDDFGKFTPPPMFKRSGDYGYAEAS